MNYPNNLDRKNLQFLSSIQEPYDKSEDEFNYGKKNDP
jgi:hypothetical protein